MEHLYQDFARYFRELPLKINGAPGNIQGDLTGLGVVEAGLISLLHIILYENRYTVYVSLNIQAGRVLNFCQKITRTETQKRISKAFDEH